MYLCLLIVGFFGFVNAKNFYIPENIDFITRYYHNASQPAFYNQTLRTMCYDTLKKDGVPNCCNKILNSINVFNTTNTKFGDIFGDINGTLVSYDCLLSDYNKVTTGEVFSYIGLISLTVFSIVMIYYIFRCLCSCCSRNSYQSV